MTSLAGLYSRQGKYDSAEALYESSLKMTRRQLGEDHRDTLVTMNCLAGVYERQGKYDAAEVLKSQYDKAEILYESCLEKNRSSLGDDHPDTLTSMRNLAGVYFCQGKYDAAEILYELCLEKRRFLLGEIHPDTLTAMTCLPGVYSSQEKVRQYFHLVDKNNYEKSRTDEVIHQTESDNSNLISKYEISDYSYEGEGDINNTEEKIESNQIEEQLVDEGNPTQSNEFISNKYIYDHSNIAYEETQSILLNHPLHRSNKSISLITLEDHLLYLHQQSECHHKPIFITMANVFSDLYWQLIENFIYSMVKFHLIACTLMVCVSDVKCMELCRMTSFPCFDFQYQQFHPDIKLPSALEQIGELKLLHIPKALQKGVDIMMIDLDVGFLDDPMKLIKRYNTSKSDVFVQKDMSFVMNRTKEGWRTWYTVPLPNIGIFLCRGNEKTVKMFEMAWTEYQAIDKPIKHNPGKDQNKVVGAMQSARSLYHLRWEYISIQSAVLLDKIYKFEDRRYELGGEAAVEILNKKGAHAVHTTCYEQKTKVLGLKAANAFWNPLYYDPHRRTLTKPLLYLNEKQLRNEVRSLIYLGMVSNRSVIIPNILGDEKLIEGLGLYQDRALWPAFRVVYFKKLFIYHNLVTLLEPSFYWRIDRDYSKKDPLENSHFHNNETVPIHLIHVNEKEAKSLQDVEKELLSSSHHSHSRVVLNVYHHTTIPTISQDAKIRRWASDSVGIYDEYQTEFKTYAPLPKIIIDEKRSLSRSQPPFHYYAKELVENVRLCLNIFDPKPGNRSCFDKCD